MECKTKIVKYLITENEYRHVHGRYAIFRGKYNIFWILMRQFTMTVWLRMCMFVIQWIRLNFIYNSIYQYFPLKHLLYRMHFGKTSLMINSFRYKFSVASSDMVDIYEVKTSSSELKSFMATHE